MASRTADEINTRVRDYDTSGAGPGALGDSLAKPELARKFHDDAVRSLPGGARGRDRPNARPS